MSSVDRSLEIATLATQLSDTRRQVATWRAEARKHKAAAAEWRTRAIEAEKGKAT